MFTDARSKRVIFVAHCVLNQNSISDGTADYPACHEAVVRMLMDAQVGLVQMPCPELCCLGLDRGNVLGAENPVVTENTRIRKEMLCPAAEPRLAALVDLVVLQIAEYQRHGFDVLGIVGINRSPCCGVDTTSDHDMELPGRGVFVAAIQAALNMANLKVPVIGIKANPDAASQVRALL